MYTEPTKKRAALQIHNNTTYRLSAGRKGAKVTRNSEHTLFVFRLFLWLRSWVYHINTYISSKSFGPENRFFCVGLRPFHCHITGKWKRRTLESITYFTPAVSSQLRCAARINQSIYIYIYIVLRSLWNWMGEEGVVIRRRTRNTKYRLSGHYTYTAE